MLPLTLLAVAPPSFKKPPFAKFLHTALTYLFSFCCHLVEASAVPPPPPHPPKYTPVSDIYRKKLLVHIDALPLSDLPQICNDGLLLENFLKINSTSTGEYHCSSPILQFLPYPIIAILTTPYDGYMQSFGPLPDHLADFYCDKANTTSSYIRCVHSAGCHQCMGSSVLMSSSSSNNHCDMIYDKYTRENMHIIMML